MKTYETGSTRNSIAIRAAIVVVAAALAGGSAFAWQRSEVRDREAAMEIAIEERDAARREAAGLSDEMQGMTARLAELEAQTERSRETIERLRRRLDKLIGSCDPDQMLAAIKYAIEIGAEGVFWESVDMQECRNGYARVYARWGGTPPPGTSLEESEQVFLSYQDGAWIVIASGTGISCADVQSYPDVCEALDLG